MKKLYIYLSILFFASACLFAGCGTKNPTTNNPTDSSSCGAPTVMGNSYNLAILQYDFPYSYLDNGNRTYILDMEVDSICTDLHINGTFKASMKTDSGAVFTIEAAIKWYILWEARSNGGSVYSSNVMNWEALVQNVGLKQVFGENAGSVTGNIYISFPTRGSEALDSAFLMATFISAEMEIPYRFHKPESLSDKIDPDMYKDFKFASDTRKDLHNDFMRMPIAERKVVIINQNYKL